MLVLPSFWWSLLLLMHRCQCCWVEVGLRQLSQHLLGTLAVLAQLLGQAHLLLLLLPRG
jgi:hypothetical protein